MQTRILRQQLAMYKYKNSTKGGLYTRQPTVHALELFISNLLILQMSGVFTYHH